MSSQSIFGPKIWNEFVRYGCSLLNEQESLLPNNHQQIFLQVFSKSELNQMNSDGYSSQILLRIAFGRIYYGCMQIIIEDLNVKRFVKDSSIHTRVKIALKNHSEPKLFQYFKKLYYLRIWADYRPETFETHLKIDFSQALRKQMKIIVKILILLRN